MSLEARGEGLKKILRNYPTGVTVVTSLLDGKPWGGTMNSFTSVSLEPPLVALFVMENSRTSAAIQQSGKYIINILKHDQEDLARKFANDGPGDKFEGVQYRISDDGIPYLSESMGYLECTLDSSQKLADHVLFLGRVVNASPANSDEALIYYRREFRSFK